MYLHYVTQYVVLAGLDRGQQSQLAAVGHTAKARRC